jgi:hypothetical protein
LSVQILLKKRAFLQITWQWTPLIGQPEHRVKL